MNTYKIKETQFYRYLHNRNYLSMIIIVRSIKLCLLISFVFLSLVSYSCTRPKEITIEEFNRMDYIFIGTSVNIDETPYYIDMPDAYIKITFNVEKVFKGDTSLKTVSIYTPFLSTLCRLEIKANQKWLIFASNSYSKFITTKESSSIVYDSIKNNSIDLLSEISSYKNCYYIGHYSNGRVSGKGSLKNSKPDGLWKYYDDKGFLSYGGYYKDGIKDSTWLFYWDLKRQFTKSVYTFKNGNFDGKQLEYYITDTIGKIYFYKDDKLNGNYFEFYKNGKIKMNGLYKDNLKTGIWTYYDETTKISIRDTIPWNGHFTGRDSTGNIISEGNYKNGLQIGEWVLRDEKGKIYEKDNYKGGIVNGKRTEWYSNGQKATDGNYVMGAKNGIFMSWYENGSLKSEMRYMLDTLQYTKLWNDDGIKILEEILNKGIYESRITWDDNGSMLSAEEYKDGNPSGTWEQYVNGILNWKREIINNETSIDTWFFENGRKKEEGKFNYNTGQRIGEWKIYNKKGRLQETREYSQK